MRNSFIIKHYSVFFYLPQHVKQFWTSFKAPFFICFLILHKHKINLLQSSLKKHQSAVQSAWIEQSPLFAKCANNILLTAAQILCRNPIQNSLSICNCTKQTKPNQGAFMAWQWSMNDHPTSGQTDALNGVVLTCIFILFPPKDDRNSKVLRMRCLSWPRP